MHAIDPHDLEVELELVYEWTAEPEIEADDALEDAWFDSSDDRLAEIEDVPVRERPTLRERVAGMISARRRLIA